MLWLKWGTAVCVWRVVPAYSPIALLASREDVQLNPTIRFREMVEMVNKIALKIKKI